MLPLSRGRCSSKPSVTAVLRAVTGPLGSGLLVLTDGQAGPASQGLWATPGGGGLWRLPQGLLELEQACPALDDFPNHEAGGGRPQLVVGPQHGGLLQELEAGLKCHLLQRG